MDKVIRMKVEEERVCKQLARFRGEGFLLEIAKMGCDLK